MENQPPKNKPLFDEEDRNRSKRSAELEARLNRLGDRLEDEAEETTSSQSSGRANTKGIGQAMRMSSEFIAGILVGAGIGYAIDYFLGTTPWGMIILLMLGFAAATLNVLRGSGAVAESSYELHKSNEFSDAQAKAGADEMYDDD